MTTVKTVALLIGHECVRTILRAFSFHPECDSLWELPVTYNPRLASRAGQYHHKPPSIDLHVALVGPKCSPREHEEAFLHELAHAMEHRVYGRTGHGEGWHEMMHQLGQQPTRTHRIAACTTHLAHRTTDSADALDL